MCLRDYLVRQHPEVESISLVDPTSIMSIPPAIQLSAFLTDYTDSWSITGVGLFLDFIGYREHRLSILLMTAPSGKITVPDVSSQPRLSHSSHFLPVDAEHVALDRELGLPH